MMLTDLLWARAARAGALAHLRRSQRTRSSIRRTTAALLWPRPGAIRFDAPAAGQSARPPRSMAAPARAPRLERASLLLPWSEGGLSEVPAAARRGDRALVLPVPVGPSDRLGRWTRRRLRAGRRSRLPARSDIAAITYAANPEEGPGSRARGLDEGTPALRGARGGRGLDRRSGERWARAARRGRASDRNARAARSTAALLRRARVFVCAPRREDYGQAQLEALADGCQLVSTEAPVPMSRWPSRASSTGGWSERISRRSAHGTREPLPRLSRARARAARADSARRPSMRSWTHQLCRDC